MGHDPERAAATYLAGSCTLGSGSASSGTCWTATPAGGGAGGPPGAGAGRVAAGAGSPAGAGVGGGGVGWVTRLHGAAGSPGQDGGLAGGPSRACGSSTPTNSARNGSASRTNSSRSGIAAPRLVHAVSHTSRPRRRRNRIGKRHECMFRAIPASPRSCASLGGPAGSALLPSGSSTACGAEKAIQVRSPRRARRTQPAGATGLALRVALAPGDGTWAGRTNVSDGVSRTLSGRRMTDRV